MVAVVADDVRDVGEEPEDQERQEVYDAVYHGVGVVHDQAQLLEHHYVDEGLVVGGEEFSQSPNNRVTST